MANAHISSRPTLVLEEYFSGALQAWGYFRTRDGVVQRQFTADLMGTWDQGRQRLVLEEDFTFDDGERELRIWELFKTGPDAYVGRTDDVIGQAKGTTQGNSFHWTYDFSLRRPNGKRIRLRFDDWMFLQPDGVLLNQARVSKFGIRVAEVLICFQQAPARAETRAPAATTTRAPAPRLRQLTGQPGE